LQPNPNALSIFTNIKRRVCAIRPLCVNPLPIMQQLIENKGIYLR